MTIEREMTVETNEFWMHPSDHYGIECQFRLTDASKKLPDSSSSSCVDSYKVVHKSALAIIIPNHEAAEFIQAVRKQHDPQFDRWPPHINVLYPFVEDITLDTGRESSQSSWIAQVFTCLARFQPFRCDLQRLSVFNNNGVVYLEPSREANNQIKKIYDELIGIFLK